MQWKIENVVIITIKPLWINQISALNNPLGVDVIKQMTQTKSIYSSNKYVRAYL